MLIAFSPARDATMKTYKQLTYEQRCQIYALSKTDMSQNKIAKQLNVSQSTISREFFRNIGKRGYRFKQAQTLTNRRRLVACKAIKMTTILIALIESKLNGKWSPEQVSGWLREDQGIDISYKTIYQHIGSDKQCGGHLFQHLRRKGKAYQSRSKDKQAGRGFIKNRISIDERPDVVDDKSRAAKLTQPKFIVLSPTLISMLCSKHCSMLIRLKISKICYRGISKRLNLTGYLRTFNKRLLYLRCFAE
jgi:IS30 family transposase